MSDLRSRFEEIPEIAEILKDGAYWDGEIYRRKSMCKLTHLYYLRGAWMMFQELLK